MALRDTAAALERLFPTDEPGAGKDPDDSDAQTLMQLDRVLTGVVQASGELRALLAASEPRVAGTAPAGGLAALDAALLAHERRLFGYAAILIVLAAGLAWAIVWYARSPQPIRK